MTSHGHSMSRADIVERYEQIVELTLREYTAPQIAKKLNCSTRMVFRARNKYEMTHPGKPWTPEEVAIAERLLDEEGCSYREVGRTLGRHFTSVGERFPGRSQCTAADGPRLRKMMQELKEV